MIPPASGVTAGAFAEESEAEEKVVAAGEVVDEVRFLVTPNFYTRSCTKNVPYLTCSVCIICHVLVWFEFLAAKLSVRVVKNIFLHFLDQKTTFRRLPLIQ